MQGRGFANRRAWPADAIRLDAYDAAAGAGGFYAKFGCTEVGRVSYRDTPFDLLRAPSRLRRATPGGTSGVATGLQSSIRSR